MIRIRKIEIEFPKWKWWQYGLIFALIVWILVNGSNENFDSSILDKLKQWWISK